MKQCRRILRGLWRALWMPFVPFNPTPEPILLPPEPPGEVAPETIAQCEKIYERTETTRKFVEEKARATFTILSFLAPLTGAGFVFLLSQADQAGLPYHIAKWLIIAAGALIFAAFLSIARATAVKVHMDMLLNSVIDEASGTFKPYDAKNYVRGLLYCASWNGGMNAHVAQFVRGAHVLISLSVVLSFVAAVPLGSAYADASLRQAADGKQNPIAVQLTVLHQDMLALRQEWARSEMPPALPKPMGAAGGDDARPHTGARAPHARLPSVSQERAHSKSRRQPDQ